MHLQVGGGVVSDQLIRIFSNLLLLEDRELLQIFESKPMKQRDVALAPSRSIERHMSRRVHEDSPEFSSLVNRPVTVRKPIPGEKRTDVLSELAPESTMTPPVTV